MRNPFRLRASQRTSSDEEFVRLFSPGALDLLDDIKDPFGGVVFLRSAPGGGKTTLLRMLTPRPLQLVHQLAAHHPQVRTTHEALRSVGALNDDGPAVLGAMVAFNKEYQDLAAFDRGNALFRELVNSRIVIATLRAVLERTGRNFPADLHRLQFEWEPESNLSIPASADGQRLFDWASEIERNFYDRMDDLGDPEPPAGGHARLDAIRWFARARISDPRGPIEARRLLLLDEIQTLSASQRQTLIQLATDAREACGLWLAERLEALNHQDLLSEGALQERDYEGVVQLERRWGGQRAKTFNRFVESVANLRLGKADGFADREFFPLIGETDDLDDWEAPFTLRSEQIEREIVGANGRGGRYATWLENARACDGTAIDRAVRWRLTQVLVARDLQRAQASFEFDALTGDEFEKRARGVEKAAEHFVRREAGAPIYFGREALGQSASNNVEQYLEIAGEMFEEISAKVGSQRETPTPLSATRQDALLRQVARSRWDQLVRRMPRGYEARRLLEAIGTFCQQQTFRPTAPYAPGVTGVAITMADRAQLIDRPDGEIRPFIPLRDVLTSLVAQNLLVPRVDHQNNGRTYVVFYLNRLLCVHFDLPLGYGGWRHKPLSSLVRWQEVGERSEDLAEVGQLV